jgi:hypothetical protein
MVRTDRRKEAYQTSKEPYAFGLAKTAYVIRTSRGDVRPLGYPTLDNLSKSSYSLSEYGRMGAGAQREIEMGDIQETDIAQITQRARDFLQGEHFEQAGGLGMVSAFAQLVEAIEEETDFVRKDWRVSALENLNGATLLETCLEPGSHVCALGRWDQARSALLPPVELVAGDEENVRKVLIAGKRSSALFGLVFGVLINAMVLAFVLFAPPM